MMIRTFTEMSKYKTFQERFTYLKLTGIVGASTFGYDRYLNQILYKSRKWIQARDYVIVRDNGCDLGIDEYRVFNRVIIHHMNPLTIEEIESGRDCIFDPEFLICTSLNTHNAIHYSDESKLYKIPIARKPNDTCPWKN